MSGPPQVSDPSVAILTQLAGQRVTRLAQMFGTDALAWLALPPTWTEPVASAASFPSKSTSLAQFLDLALEQGLIDRDPPLRADPEIGRAFWISESDREPVLTYLRQHTSFGEAQLRKVTVQIAKRLDSVQSSVPLPDTLRYWTDLARRADDPFGVARQLGEDIATLTNANNTGEALARVDAGRSLARAIGGPMDAAVLLGNRRIGLAYRQAADRRHLKGYFPRNEQEKAFEALLDPRSPAWALHYLGIGGAGKTMLLRSISNPPEAPDGTRRELVISRVDFDYVNPDYPVRRPGQLLLDLAVELRSFGRSTQEEQLFDKIRNTTAELHETLGAAPPPANPLANVERPEFDRILVGFCDLVSVLPPPVVLVLDTCEELARVPVTNGILPSVEATFQILTRVHKAVDSVRVVFAGRRPIASSGYGWELRQGTAGDRSAPAVPERGLRQFLKPRPFLALHEIRGLVPRDAHTFLATRLGREPEVALEEAIFKRSLDPGRAADIVRTDDRPDVDDGEPRYSLFDLALYGDWVREDPSLDAARIASGSSDPYVDLRIVQRVRQSAVRDALPAISALGRFDAPMLRGAFPDSLSDEAYAEAYRELADYEWLDLQRDSASGNFFLEVDRNLLPRIRSYFDQPSRRADAAQTVARLGPGLAALVRRTPLGDLSINHLQAALTILPPAAAAGLWVEVLLRVRSEGDLNWLRTITERLIGTSGPLARGLELAASSVALLSGANRRGDDASLVDWPDETTSAWLTRCRRAVVATQRLRDGSRFESLLLDEIISQLRAFSAFSPQPELVPGPDPIAAGILARRMSEEEAAAMVSALEAHVDLQPPATSIEERRPDLGEIAEAVAAWADVLRVNEYPPGLVGMAQALAARWAAQAWDENATSALCGRALQTATTIWDAGGGLWLFWRAPAFPADRIQHEMLLLHQELRIAEFPNPVAWLSNALSRSETIDGERLASAIELQLLHHELPEPTDLGLSEVADGYVLDRAAVTAAHERTPPLFTTLARKRAALGDFDRADVLLRTRAQAAEVTRADPETVWNATLDRISLACRSRQVPRDLPSAVKGLSRATKEAWTNTGLHVLKALTGVDVTDDFIQSSHDSWRTWFFETAKDARGDLEGFEQRRSKEPRLVGDRQHLCLSDALDGVEAMRVARLQGFNIGTGWTTFPPDVTDLEDLVRGMLRLYALDPIADDELAAGIMVAKPLRVWMSLSVRVAMPPGSAPLQAVQRAHLVAMVQTIVEQAGRAQPSSSSIAAPSAPDAQALRLLNHVGVRRWTALAQEEGELLALRLPEAGLKLLELAMRLAQASNDSPATIMAAATGRLAGIRADRPERVSALLLPLKEAWSGLDAVGATSWSALEGVAAEIVDPDRSSSDSTNAIRGPAWLPWCARVILSLVSDATWEHRALWFERGEDVLRRFPDQAPSPEINLTLRFTRTGADRSASTGAVEPTPPIETSDALTKLQLYVLTGMMLVLVAVWLYLVSINAFGPTADPTPASARFLWPILGAAAAVIAVVLAIGRRRFVPIVGGILLVVSLLSFVYWAIGKAADLVLPFRLGQFGRTALTFAFFGALFSLQPLLRAIRSFVVRRSTAMIWLTAPHSTHDVREEVAASQTFTAQLSCNRVTLEWPLPVPRSRDLRPWSGTVDTPGMKPYAEAAMAIAPEVLEPLREIRSQLGTANWLVPLATSAGSYAPWEGVLSLAIARGDTESSTPTRHVREPLFFYRWGPERPGESSLGEARVADAWADGPVGLIGGLRDHGWSGAPRGFLVLDRSRLAEKGLPSIATDPSVPTLVHAVGTPVVSSGGPRLQIERREGAELFLDTGLLPDRVPLLILQQEPADSRARVASDREQASLLRAVAADLFDSHCDAVIVIPSLPLELAELVVGRIAARVSRGAIPKSLSGAAAGWLSAVSKRIRLLLGADPQRLALEHLAMAVRDARDAIFEWNGFEASASAIDAQSASPLADRSGADRWADREVAWDLCLFARPRESGGGEMHIARERS